MNMLDSREQLMQIIAEIDTQLEKNNVILSVYRNCTVDDIGEELYDKILTLYNYSVQLMINRNEFMNMLEKNYIRD